MELEQTRLVNEMHSARLKNPEAGKAASLEVFAHAKKMEDFAEQVIQHPEIKDILETNEKIKLTQLANFGGFSSIQKRLYDGKWLEEDIYVLAAKLQNKGMRKSHMQMQDRNLGRRKR